ncbi:hypothetical protein ABT127_29960 [Streptomyces sp. NPDC001904]|uniref:hypothetical protein n=1 Tax=Streptomyces sp. NPDC001904 TaxID=3154531 RepID=UPI003329C457
MTSNSRLVPVQTLLVLEVCRLLEYGLTKECTTSRELQALLREAHDAYGGRAAVPLPVDVLPRLHRTLLLLCIRAGEQFPPGEQVVRFTRAAHQIHALLPTRHDRSAHRRPGPVIPVA